MLQKLQQVAQEGALRITHAYLGHIKKEEDRKVLDHAEALAWEEVEPSIRSLLEQHLLQAVEGALGEVNFPCYYTGEVLSVAKVASPEYDRTANRPAVEILEAIRDLREVDRRVLVELGNGLAYKVMAAGAIRNHLVCILKFFIIPELGAAPVNFVFATLLDLDDREESLFDEARGRFVTQMLNNVVKRSGVSRAVFFPCLDEEGREMADLLVYAGSGAGSWFKALEVTRRLSPSREGQALVRMITEQSSTEEVPHDLFRRMGNDLLDQAAEGLGAEQVLDSLERAVGHGVDRLGFKARWEAAFGDLAYRASYDSLFGGSGTQKPTRLKMRAGGIQITLTPADLEHFRQVNVGKRTFILFEVPEMARVTVGKDLDLRIKPVALEDLERWLKGEERE
ncbi:MAG TPA: hypothetical protein VIL07_00555 [Symbiobacteriaceae bacterium]